MDLNNTLWDKYVNPTALSIFFIILTDSLSSQEETLNFANSKNLVHANIFPSDLWSFWTTTIKTVLIVFLML